MQVARVGEAARASAVSRTGGARANASKLARLVAVLVLALLGATRPGLALENLKVYRGYLIIEGKIELGDFDKFRDFLGNRENFEKISAGVFIASPGGNMVESLKIGRMIRALQLSTDAPSMPDSGKRRRGEPVIKPNHLAKPRSHYTCASACFFLYIAGVYRHPNALARLGIHRPLRTDETTLSFEQNTGVNLRIRELITAYLKEMDTPVKYVDLMYSTPSNEIRWIAPDEIASDLQGFVPEIKKQLAETCPMPPGAAEPQALPAPEIRQCWRARQNELSAAAWPKIFPRR